MAAVGKNIAEKSGNSGKKGKEKQYHLPYNGKAVRRNIKQGRWEGDEFLWEDNQNGKKMGVGKNIKLQGTLYTKQYTINHQEVRQTSLSIQCSLWIYVNKKVLKQLNLT